VLRLFEQAEIVEPVEEIAVCRDQADDKFFACAVAGRADYIVTEDKDILDVGEYRGVRPVSAAEFLDRLAQE
jgi:putative PIN family toxin of toxin-antitoxin system